MALDVARSAVTKAGTIHGHNSAMYDSSRQIPFDLIAIQSPVVVNKEFLWCVPGDDRLLSASLRYRPEVHYDGKEQ